MAVGPENVGFLELNVDEQKMAWGIIHHIDHVLREKGRPNRVFYQIPLHENLLAEKHLLNQRVQKFVENMYIKAGWQEVQIGVELGMVKLVSPRKANQ